MKAVKIKAGIAIENVEIITLSDKNYFEELYHHLDCRCFDIVTININGKDFFMYVDDEGLLKESPYINPVAWHWYSNFKPDAPIVGNVIITSMTEEGDTKTLTDDEASMIAFYATYLLLAIQSMPEDERYTD